MREQNAGLLRALTAQQHEHGRFPLDRHLHIGAVEGRSLAVANELLHLAGVYPSAGLSQSGVRSGRS